MSAPGARPRVSFGLPVYNGERYLRRAIDSILAQRYTDFELVISDNASTDSTGAIGQEYASRDARVRYHRNPVNIGGSPNYNRSFELSRGDYFASGGHDDSWSPNWLERCVAVLDARPEVVLAFGEERTVDADGRVVPSKPFEPRVEAKRPSARFRDMIQLDHGIDVFAGLVRSDILRRTPLEGPYADCDRVLYAELALYGPFARVPEAIFYRGRTPDSSATKYASRHERTAWFDPHGTDKLVFPHPRQLAELVRAVRRVPLPASERTACYSALLAWAGKYNDRLRADTVDGLKHVVRPLLLRLRSNPPRSA